MTSSTLRRRGERGVTLVLLAILIVMFLGMAALVVDYGMVKSEIAEGQRMVDAAALAGASVYRIEDAPPAFYEPAAIDTAQKYALLHKVGAKPVLLSEVEILADPGGAADSVTVIFRRSGITTWFANVLGITTVGIRAAATAQMQAPAGTDTTLVLIH